MRVSRTISSGSRKHKCKKGKHTWARLLLSQSATKVCTKCGKEKKIK